MQQGPIVPTGILSLNEYMQTAQGKALVAARRVFVYEGRFWGSSKGRPARIHPSQLDGGKIGKEVDEALDIDGTKARLLDLLRSRQDVHDHEVALEKARRQTQAAREIADLRKTAEVQKQEFGEADPDLLGTIKRLEERLRFRPKPVAAPTAPVPGSPEDLAQFVPHPELHPALVHVPALHDAIDADAELRNAPPAVGVGEPPDLHTPDMGEVTSRLSRMEDMVSKLYDLVMLTPVEQAHAKTVVSTGPTAEESVANKIPDAAVERESPPSTTCTVCDPPKSSPKGHFNPPKWLMGHNMAKHSKKKSASA